MDLFDSMNREDSRPAPYAEPQFVYLNRTVKPEAKVVRTALEDWFSRYPIEGKAELRARFRSKIDSQHHGAFFELVLHELLLKLNYCVTVHPELAEMTTAPDFLAVGPAGDSFYLEAAVATNESEEEAAAQARIDQVYDILNRRVKSPSFFLWIDVEGAPKTPPPAKRLASWLNKHLATLDPDDIARQFEIGGMDAIPTWYYEHDGWVVKFRPWPKSPEARNKKGLRPIGMQSTGWWQMNLQTSIRDAILRKAGRYGDLELPYIVAVNVLEFFDDEDVMSALFGTEQYTIPLDALPEIEPEQMRMSRARDGAWVGPDGPRNTRVSAVLLTSRLSPWNLLSGKSAVKVKSESE